MSSFFLCLLTSQVCLVAALERRDRQTFWISCSYFCDAAALLAGALEVLA